jgi:hypothetical protein
MIRFIVDDHMPKQGFALVTMDFSKAYYFVGDKSFVVTKDGIEEISTGK